MNRVVFLLVCVSVSPSTSQGLFPAVDVSLWRSGETGCDDALRTLREGVESHQLWALKMVDAGVKTPLGLLSQTLVHFGNFDECLNLRAPIEPQYCLFDVSPTHPANVTWSGIKWGLCVPAQCSVQDLRDSLQTYMDQERGEGVTVELIPEACTSPSTRKSDVDTLDITYCLAFLGVVLLVIFATLQEKISNPHFDGVSPPKSVIQCLSVRYGMNNLLRQDAPIGDLNLKAIYGVHFLSLFIITMSHRWLIFYVYMILTNFYRIEEIYENPWTSIWLRVDLFNDIFFFTSSFLLGLLYFSQLDKHYVSPLKICFMRVFRLLPALTVTVFFAATWMRHLGDGPLWNTFLHDQQGRCRDNWWTNLFFIQNYVRKYNQCLIHTWYISCDMQLFACGTLLVLLLHKKPRLGALATVLVIVASTVARFLGVLIHDLPCAFPLYNGTFYEKDAFFKVFGTIYIQMHYRGTSYIYGLLAGVYVYQRRTQPLGLKTTYILEFVGLMLCLVVYWSGAIYFVFSKPPTVLMTAFYAALSHSVFGIGLTLLFISWTCGYKTPLSNLISWKGFVPLSKLSYCTYLFSLVPMYVWLGSARTLVFFNAQGLISWSLGDLFFSMLYALVVYLTVETPIRNLTKYLTTDFSRSPKVSVPPSKNAKKRPKVLRPS